MLVELVLRALLFLVSELAEVEKRCVLDDEDVPLDVGWMGMSESYPPHSSNGRFPCEWRLTRCRWGGEW